MYLKKMREEIAIPGWNRLVQEATLVLEQHHGEVSQGQNEQLL